MIIAIIAITTAMAAIILALLAARAASQAASLAERGNVELLRFGGFPAPFRFLIPFGQAI